MLSKNPEGVRGDTRIQKYAFLVDKLIGSDELDSEFGFIAHDFGPWSEALADILDRLENYGLVKKKQNRKSEYRITDRSMAIIEEIERSRSQYIRAAETISKDFRRFTDDEIVAMIYDLYPDYASNSFIKEKMLSCGSSDFFVVPIVQENTVSRIVSRCGRRLTVRRLGTKITVREMGDTVDQ